MNDLGANTACDADPTEDCDKYYKIFDRTAYKACKHYESYELREQNEHVDKPVEYHTDKTFQRRQRTDHCAKCKGGCTAGNTYKQCLLRSIYKLRIYIS